MTEGGSLLNATKSRLRRLAVFGMDRFYGPS